MEHLKLFVSYYKTEKRLFLIDMACASLIAVLDLTFPVITRMFMKDFIPNQNMRAVAIWGRNDRALFGPAGMPVYS